MRRFLCLLPVVLFCLLFSFPSEARADGLIITSGSFTVSEPTQRPSFSFNGQGLSLSNSSSPADAGVVNARACSPCPAGTTVSLLSLHGGTSLGSGPATINNTFYERLFYSGTLMFQGSVIIPASTDSVLLLQAPFTFSGFLQGCTTDPVASGGCSNPVFSTTLSGQGQALLELVAQDGAGLYRYRSITYSFQPQATPEPTTLLLLGTGLAGMTTWYRRQRAR